MNDFCDFEKKVIKGLERCGISLEACSSGFRLGAAVSGGADSVSLLVSLSNIFASFNAARVSEKECFLELYVISVNHNIRPENECRGDVDFVKSLSEKLGNNIHFTSVELERGLVEIYARERDCGIEEAARFLRYDAFRKFSEKNKLDALCLAHNKNDQLETLLMRFLQGGGTDSLSGIPYVRQLDDCGTVIARPLLGIERDEIEFYLKSKKIEWRTDKSNLDDAYLRNNIRLNLIPLLNEKFDGWKDALLFGREKALMDKNIILKQTEEVPVKIVNDAAVIKLSDFTRQMDGVKYRLLLKACNSIGFSKRIPFVFLKSVLAELKCGGVKTFDNIEFSIKNDELFVKKFEKLPTDFSFFDIIEEDCKIELPCGVLDIKKSVYGFEYPFILRSAVSGDKIRTSDGKQKKVSDIFSDWHVQKNIRWQILLAQKTDAENQDVFCIFGAAFGYKDWIVK